MCRTLLTASLLNAWLWSYSKEGFKDFLKVLERKPTEQNEAMLNGIQFENMVSRWNKGYRTEVAHPWYNCIKTCAEILSGSQEQVKAYKDYSVDGMDFLLYGRLDNLKRGIIYDTKFSKNYQYGKYYKCPQHSLYFETVPEARKFVYIIANGKDVYKEEYRRFDYIPIDMYIRPFVKFLIQNNLMEIYMEKWKTKGDNYGRI